MKIQSTKYLADFRKTRAVVLNTSCSSFMCALMQKPETHGLRYLSDETEFFTQVQKAVIHQTLFK